MMSTGATRKHEVSKLQEHLNCIDPHIKFTITLLITYGLSFLYTLTKATHNSIESTVYRRPTHTDRHWVYSSNHPISAKVSVIHTLIHRAKQVCSTTEFLANEMDHLHKVLYYKTITTQHSSCNKAIPNRKPNPSTGKFIDRPRVVISYIKVLSEQ